MTARAWLPRTDWRIPVIVYAADVLPGAAGTSIARARHVRRAQVINGIGAVFTAVVLIVVFATKVTQVSGWNSATTRA